MSDWHCSLHANKTAWLGLYFLVSQDVGVDSACVLDSSNL